MKIELTNEKIVVYLNNYYFNTSDKDKLIREIKNLFIKLIKIYKLSFSGIYKVNLYENKIYGSILEIIKQEELLFSRDLIDIKVSVKKNNDIYLKTSDYFVFENYKNIYYKASTKEFLEECEKKFFFLFDTYLNALNKKDTILDTSNYLKLIEFCKIVYNIEKSDLKPLAKMKKIC